MDHSDDIVDGSSEGGSEDESFMSCSSRTPNSSGLRTSVPAKARSKESGGFFLESTKSATAKNNSESEGDTSSVILVGETPNPSPALAQPVPLRNLRSIQESDFSKRNENQNCNGIRSDAGDNSQGTIGSKIGTSLSEEQNGNSENLNPNQNYSTIPLEDLETNFRALDMDVGEPEVRQNLSQDGRLDGATEVVIISESVQEIEQVKTSTHTTTTPLSALGPKDSIRSRNTFVGAQSAPIGPEGFRGRGISGIATSTPVFQSHRKLNCLESLDMPGIVGTGGRHLNLTRAADEENNLNDSAHSGRTEEETSSDSGDVNAVSFSSSDYNPQDSDDQIQDESADNLDLLGAAALPLTARVTSQEKPRPSPDIDEITEKFRKQNIRVKVPLVKYLEDAPNPFRQVQSASAIPGSKIPAEDEEWKGDIIHVVNKLATAINSMPDHKQDLDDFKLPKKLRITLYPHQIHGVRWMLWRESLYPGGGILADEMGLGKTVMALSLILSGREPDFESDTENWLSRTNKKLIASKATLVVCPLGCMKQWYTEVTTKAKGLRVEIYHGPQRSKMSAAMLSQCDVVITGYSVIGSEISKPDDDPHNRCKSPLLRVNWERLILDEGHVIRNPKTNGAQGACRITARHRWILTGTPVHNKPEDFYSLIKFLQLRPFDDPSVWKYWIGMKTVPTRNLERLHLIGKAMILRRTKDEVLKEAEADGSSSTQSIPPKTITDVELEFGEDEKKIYDHLEEYAKGRFEYFIQQRELKQTAAHNVVATGWKGKKNTAAEVALIFAHFLALITRLRQAAVLPFLIRTMLGEDEAEENEDEAEENEDEAEEDEDTYDPVKDPINQKNPAFDHGFISAKIKAVLKDLKQLKEEAKEKNTRMDKVIIVSQWTTLLDILHQHLVKKGFSTAFLTGKENIEERASTMTVFNENPKRPQVLLLSITAGGVGVTLTGANHVFFMEPHWNPQMERQAQDRVHRYGQTKPVFIRRYIMKDTLEERVLNLQAQKINLADGILNSAKAVEGAGLNIEDMKTLFGL